MNSYAASRKPTKKNLVTVVDVKKKLLGNLLIHVSGLLLLLLLLLYLWNHVLNNFVVGWGARFRAHNEILASIEPKVFLALRAKRLVSVKKKGSATPIR